VAFWGGQDGSENALDVSGTPPVPLWSVNLGTSYDCGSVPEGITSTAPVTTLPGVTDPVLFVGGNNPNVGIKDSTPFLYALDALTGNPIANWNPPKQLSNDPTAYISSSPVVYTPPGATDPSVYIGLAAAQCQPVQGQVFQFDAVTGTLQHTFDVVPNGCTGGGGVEFADHRCSDEHALHRYRRCEGYVFAEFV
jgi:hypothetical protein